MIRHVITGLLCTIAALLGLTATALNAGAATGATPSPSVHLAKDNTAARANGYLTPQSPCAVSVTSFHSTVPGDDTPAFTQAIASAVATHPTCYAQGPSGDPQAVVYVPAGTYRVANLYFPSNVRMEVDAGAVLQLPADRNSVPAGTNVSMMIWDSVKKGAPAVRNISIVGVGSSLSTSKQAIAAAGGAPMSRFDLSGDFTMNLDAATTGATNYNTGLELMNVQYFDIENLVTIQNATNGPNTPIVQWPTSARAVIRLHARQDSPIAGPFLQPKYGTIHNQVDVNSPRGYGPNQINGAQYVTVSDIYSQGGTALRLETDGSTNNKGIAKIGATVDHLTASDIVGVNCNRAVSLSPHGQTNGTVDVDGVYAYSCNEGVVAAFDHDTITGHIGSFDNASVRDVEVTGGSTAQLDSTTTLWTVGQSLMAVYIAPGLPWHPLIQVVNSSGSFTRQ